MPITIFKRSIHGYDRDQVDEYIAGLNRAYTHSQREYEKKIESLEAEIRRLRRDEAPAAPVREQESDDHKDKSRRYDEISQRLGEILINANAEASAMMREADERVSSTLSETLAAIESELGALSDKLRALSASAHERLSCDVKDGSEN